MCDYSLFTIPNRLASENEDLVLHRFPTGSMGLASPPDLQKVEESKHIGHTSFWSALKDFFAPAEPEPVPAVCIPPGARLRVPEVPVSMQRDYNIGSCEEVTFVETSASVNAYRDAIRFENGTEVLLQLLPSGLRLEVVSLECAEPRDAEYYSEGERLELLLRVR